MKLSEFLRHLEQAPNHELRFVLPDGGVIERHAHITEVGKVDKTFIDCGGTVRRNVHCSLQAWVADDTDHRLTPGRLASIIRKAAPILGADDLDMELEYEDTLVSQFPIESARTDDGSLSFHLTTRHTDCLAKEVCIPDESGSCCTGTGCC